MSGSGAIMVSCLLVTLPIARRFHHFQRSVAAYCRQTYANRELVIVLDRGDADTIAAMGAHLESLRREDIRVVAPGGRHSLGALRNLCRNGARGEVICQWDDDDFHHPQRVQRQLEALIESGGRSVHLEEVMQFFTDSRTLYCTNWHATETQSLPGTLMCWRAAPIRYPETEPNAHLGEDSAVSLQLMAQGGYHILTGVAHLYVYVSHGRNVWADDHHRMLARELSISRARLLRYEARLREGLRPFDFGPGAVSVQGYNGTAFTLTGSAEP